MASDTTTDSTAGASTDKTSPFDAAFKAFGSTASSFGEQAGAKAREYTSQGKDRTVDALDNVVALVNDAAAAVQEKLGDQYGGYVRQAAGAVGGFADTLRQKDADVLFDDARDIVRNSPVIAIAAAAAVGFLVARVVKSGFTEKPASESAASAEPAAPPPPSADKTPTA